MHIYIQTTIVYLTTNVKLKQWQNLRYLYSLLLNAVYNSIINTCKT